MSIENASHPEPLMTVDELSAYLCVPSGTIYQWRARGFGPLAYRIGRGLRYRQSDVDAWLETQRDERGPSVA